MLYDVQCTYNVRGTLYDVQCMSYNNYLLACIIHVINGFAYTKKKSKKKYYKLELVCHLIMLLI